MSPHTHRPALVPLVLLGISAPAAPLVAPGAARAGAPAQEQAPPAPPAPPDESQVLLSEAETQAAEGHYDKALATYKRLAEKFPASEAGTKAARRLQPNNYFGHHDL